MEGNWETEGFYIMDYLLTLKLNLYVKHFFAVEFLKTNRNVYSVELFYP
jgi:hypothetical protein